MTAFGPWTRHNGQPVPHLAGKVVQTITEVAPGETHRSTGRVIDGQGRSWDWSSGPGYTRVLRYRVAKPMGALILDSVLRRVERQKPDKGTHGTGKQPRAAQRAGDGGQVGQWIH